MKFFITGTDTGVGKTYVTQRLAIGLRRRGWDTVGLKPVCCGEREDARMLGEACGWELGIDEVNPVWLRRPLAPYVAAEREGVILSVEFFKGWFDRVTDGRRSVLVEGAGGWLVPFCRGKTMADLALSLGLPVLVVVANRLGCQNHCLLTVEAIRRVGLEVAGIILNQVVGCPDESGLDNRRVIEEFTGVPVVAEAGYRQDEISLAIW